MGGKRLAQILLAMQALTLVLLALSAHSRAGRGALSVLLAVALALCVGSFTALLWQSAQREAAQRALVESEARYRTIFQTAADGCGLVDQEARILEVNDALRRMSGLLRVETL